MPVSIEAVTVMPPRGETLESHREQAEALASLVHPLRNVILRAGGDAPESMDLPLMREKIVADTAPVLNAAVTLANGLYAFFPGHGAMPDTYDPLSRSKYAVAARTTGIRWGAPYPDRYGRGLVLPASAAVYSDEHQYLGVVSLDIRFEKLIDTLKNAHYPSYIVETLLLDDQGRVMLRQTRDPRPEGQAWGDARDLMASQGENATETLPQYADFARLVRADRDFGGAEFSERSQFAGYFRMKSLGWYFVAIAEREALLAQFVKGDL
jgi:hypothetical protein